VTRIKHDLLFVSVLVDFETFKLAYAQEVAKFPQTLQQYQQQLRPKEKPVVEPIPEHRRAAEAAAELKEMDITLVLPGGGVPLFRGKQNDGKTLVAGKEAKTSAAGAPMPVPRGEFDTKALMNLTNNGLMLTVKLSGEITKDMLGSDKSTVALPSSECCVIIVCCCLLVALLPHAHRLLLVFVSCFSCADASPMMLDTQFLAQPLAATTPLNLSTVMSTGMLKG
jgi:hypothetical protein